MAAVVMTEPDFNQLPSRVRRLLRKCLEKDPKNRLRDIADAWELVNEPPMTADAAHTEVGRRTAALPWILASLLGIVAVVILLLWLKPLSSPQFFTFQIQAPPGSRLPLGVPAFSNDGRMAYAVTDSEGMTRIHVRAIDSGETMELRGREAGLHPLWSPNGDSIAFVAGQTLRRMDFATGSVRDLIGIGFGWQAAWSRNDEILVRAGGELSRIFGQGGAVTRIPHSSDATFPSFLRDSKRFLVRVSNDSVNSIQIQSLVSGKRTWVLDDVQSAPILAPTPRGKTYLFFLRDFDLFAQEFDEASGKVLGAPVVLVSRVGRVGEPAVRPAVGVSTSGILAYQKADAVTTTQLKWLERSGLPVRTLSPDVSVSRPRLSPDQSLVVGTRPSSRQHIWVLNLKRPSSQRLTWDDTPENFAVWSKDGSHIAFLRSKRGIYATAADGRGKPKLLTETQGNPTSWSRQYLMYTFPSPPNGKIHMLDVTTGKVIQVGSPNGNSSVGQFSPDGAYIAFCSDKSGRNEVYIQPIPPGAGETQVSFSGGLVPRWRGDGREVFFVSLDGDLMAVDVKLGNAISVGTPHKLFRFDSSDGYEVVRNGYDVTRDGQQFLVASPGNVNAPITVVVNWWLMLEKRLGR